MYLHGEEIEDFEHIFVKTLSIVVVDPTSNLSSRLQARTPPILL